MKVSVQTAVSDGELYLRPPAADDKEWLVLESHIVVPNIATVDLDWKIVCPTGTISILIINLAALAVSKISDVFPELTLAGLRLTYDTYLNITITGLTAGTLYFYSVYIERPKNWELIVLEHQYDNRGNVMPAGLADIINKTLGYRDQGARL